ncbi:hypothetical protein D3C71_2069250 [compost metagenome]
MVNCTATGETSNDLDSIFLTVFIIDFFNRILMLPDNDGRGIDVEQQVAVILQWKMSERILFNSQVD